MDQSIGHCGAAFVGGVLRFSKQGNREVVFSTVISRGFVGIGFVLLVLSGQAQTSLILFADVDIATAVRTWLELKKRA